MSMEQKIRTKLESLSHAVLEVINESHHHSRGSETHYKVLLVSEIFNGLSRIERSRKIHDVLQEELRMIHSLTSRLMTPDEWAKSSENFDFQSPRCQGAKP